LVRQWANSGPKLPEILIEHAFSGRSSQAAGGDVMPAKKSSGGKRRECPREGPYLAFSSILLCITCMNPGLDLAGDLQG